MGDFKFYLTVVFPVAKTSLVTFGIYGFLSAWNMYLWPLLSTTNDTVRTVQIGLKQLQSQETVNRMGSCHGGCDDCGHPNADFIILWSEETAKRIS